MPGKNTSQGAAWKEALAFEDDVAPGGLRRLHADAEEGQGRFQKHGGGDAERAPDDRGRHQMRQDVLQEDAAVARAQRRARPG